MHETVGVYQIFVFGGQVWPMRQEILHFMSKCVYVCVCVCVWERERERERVLIEINLWKAIQSTSIYIFILIMVSWCSFFFIGHAISIRASRVCRKWREGVRRALMYRRKLSFSGWRVDDECVVRQVEGAYNLHELDMYLSFSLSLTLFFVLYNVYILDVWSSINIHMYDIIYIY